MARRKAKINLTKKAFTAIVVVVLIVAIALFSWYMVDRESFMSVYEDILAILNPQAPSLDGGGTEGNPTGKLMEIHFIDVGQGDAIYVEFPDGKDMLIDAGDTKTANTQALISYINDYGSASDGIDYVMLTHVDADHVGGMDNILETYDVKNIYMPNIGKEEADPERGYWTTVTYGQFYDAVYNEGASIKYNEGNFAIYGDSWKIDVYAPLASEYDDFDKDSDGSKEKNDMSPVMIIEYAGVRTLLSGDLNSTAESNLFSWSEEDFIARTGMSKIDCSVIKAGHHGSRDSTSMALLEFSDPEHVIICCGADNTYGHPHQEVLDRINSYDENLSGNVHITAQKGHIKMVVGDNGEYKLVWEKTVA